MYDTVREQAIVIILSLSRGKKKKHNCLHQPESQKEKDMNTKLFFSHHLDLPLGVKSALLFWI